MIKAIAMDTTRRAVLLNLGAVAAASTAAGAVVLPAVAPTVVPDPIGDLIAATPLSTRERVDRAVAEIRAAYEEAGYGLTRWGVYHPASPRESFMILAFPPAPPPPQFEGAGVYETRLIGGQQPVWWVERTPARPGFYRCRHFWRSKRPGKWQYFAEADLTFVKKIEV